MPGTLLMVSRASHTQLYANAHTLRPNQSKALRSTRYPLAENTALFIKPQSGGFLSGGGLWFLLPDRRCSLSGFLGKLGVFDRFHVDFHVGQGALDSCLRQSHSGGQI